MRLAYAEKFNYPSGNFIMTVFILAVIFMQILLRLVLAVKRKTHSHSIKKV